MCGLRNDNPRFSRFRTWVFLVRQKPLNPFSLRLDTRTERPITSLIKWTCEAKSFRPVNGREVASWLQSLQSDSLPNEFYCPGRLTTDQ